MGAVARVRPARLGLPECGRALGKAVRTTPGVLRQAPGRGPWQSVIGQAQHGSAWQTGSLHGHPEQRSYGALRRHIGDSLCWSVKWA